MCLVKQRFFGNTNTFFKVKNTFVSPDGPYWRESTDCNDNYQKDEEELVLFDKYTNSYGINPKSFCDDISKTFRDLSKILNSHGSLEYISTTNKSSLKAFSNIDTFFVIKLAN